MTSEDLPVRVAPGDTLLIDGSTYYVREQRGVVVFADVAGAVGRDVFEQRLGSADVIVVHRG